MVQHVRFGTFLCRPLQNNNVKCPSSTYFEEREPQRLIFWHLLLELNAVGDYCRVLRTGNFAVQNLCANTVWQHYACDAAVPCGLAPPWWKVRLRESVPRGERQT